MPISRFFGDVMSVPNLFRNGGLDFQDDESPLPPFYVINGALKAAGPADNSWAQVFGEKPLAAGAPVNYFKLILPKMTPVTVGQNFSKAPGVLDHVIPISPGELNLFGYQAEEANLLYQGLFTVSFSARVIQGEVALGVARTGALGSDQTETIYTEIDRNFSSREWRRFTGVFDPGKTRIGVAGLQVQRKGAAQIVEVHIGNIMLAAGAFDGLPYTGDPAATIFPRGAIIMSLGLTCPPGFVPVGGDFYPREGPPGQAGGSIHHEHDIDQSMYPNVGWKKRMFLDAGDTKEIQGLDDNYAKYKADSAEDHQHPITDDASARNTEPNNRTYLLCRRA